MAQHRGDDLGFQGLQQENYSGVKAVALGGAYTSQSSDLNSLFWNPAGLMGLQELELDISYNTSDAQWRENQRYRPNRYFVTLPFYLEGWYVPDAANNGIWDHELAADTNYVVNPTGGGNDPYSKAEADWIKKQNNSGIGHIAVAYPITLLDRQFVFAGSYSHNNSVQNFDRNDTYLTPMIGYSGYDGFVDRVDGSDTLNVDWYNYSSSRFGESTTLSAAVAYQVTEALNIGLSINVMNGQTDDILVLNKIGTFGLFDNNEFFFSYDTLDTQIKGTSDFSSTEINLGFIYKLENLDVGVNVQLPYTLERQWKYSKTVTDTGGTIQSTLSGTDELEFPAIFNFGVNIRPTEKLMVLFDYTYAQYKKAKFNYASADSLRPNWANQNILRFGLQYKPINDIALMAGYRSTPQVFIPDGSAEKDKGPISTSYSFGISYQVIEAVRIDAAYELKELRYYDQYFSNTNYNTQTLNQLHFGINYKFN